MRVAFSIMVHPSRLAHAQYTVELLRAQGVADVPLAVDTDNSGPWETSKRAWGLCDAAASHRAVLQDDISFGPNFVRSVHCGITAHPAYPQSFAPPLSRTLFRGAQALVLPTSVALDLLAWHPHHGWERFGRLDDVWLDAFFRLRGLSILYSTPPLVEHVGVRRSVARGCCSTGVVRG